MYKRTYSYIFLLIVPWLSTSILGADLSRVDFNGKQLAWVLLPSTPVSKEATDLPKPKPKPKADPAPITKPTPATPPMPVAAPAPKLIEVPAPIPAQVPVTKPLPPPAIKPAPVPVAKPAQMPVAKPEPRPATGKAQAFEWVIGLGIDLGGEVLGTVYYTDGSSAAVKANNGVVINVGGILKNGSNSAFSTQVTLGYKYGGPKGIGGDVTWSAIPLEIVEYYRPGSLRMGLGLSYQIRPQLSVNLPASSYVEKYKNAIGLLAQIGWAPLREHYSIDLRYTAIKFQLSDVEGAPTVDGSVAGIYTSYRF